MPHIKSPSPCASLDLFALLCFLQLIFIKSSLLNFPFLLGFFFLFVSCVSISSPPWLSLLYDECPLHYFHYITLYPPNPFFPFKLLFCFVSWFCILLFYLYLCFVVGCFVHHPNCTTKVLPLDYTTNIDHHSSQVRYVILFQILFYFLFVFVFVFCLCISFLLIKGWCWFLLFWFRF